ncbi:MAG: helix-turn-helix domain-containing protein [Dehalococcoidales bacterium]
MEKLTLNVSDAAIKLGVSRPSLYQAIKRGEIPVIRIGHRVLIPIAALERYLASASTKV